MSDFILTIDSDEEVPVSDIESENENHEDKEINPDFHFAIDGETTEKLDDYEEETKVKEVDLDEIIKNKGGLQEPDLDDDELALDGFGMGNTENDSDKEEDVEQPMEESQPEKPVEEDTAEAIAEFYEESAPQQAHTTFQSLQLSRPVLRGIANLNFTKPTPIQSASIPIALLGKDIVAGAQTGSGKTGAYMIPIIERLLYKPSTSTKVIILTPTRELALQVYDFGKKVSQYVNNLNLGLAVGGLNLRQQEEQLKTRPDIVIATPGRLIDHIRNSPSFSVEDIQVLVVDEADRMLEEGFHDELTEILSLIPKHKRQTLLFSATMNTKIQDLIQLSLQKPVRIMIDPPKAVASKLLQQFVRIRKRDQLKPALLYQLLKGNTNRVVVFVSRKETAHKLRIVMGLLGLKVSELHGALSQEQRLQNVKNFKSLEVPVLICTDLAARGLDIPKIELVINYDMPKTFEIYLHRVGRTARAGRDGISISFVGESSQERAIVKSAIKNGKGVARTVDWAQAEETYKTIESKESVIDEVLQEEKEAKELLRAEMELNKASNLIKHEQEIHSRPKRTWFKGAVMEQLTKHGKKVNSKKRKAMEVKKDEGRSYKKTKTDRMKINNKKKSK
ncbi:MAG: DEAD/DEAH box helicase [Asgard group archaeon]|nr:DEAD/DEAH box helicase [Asgard group archaeon]